jgi:hypothetical protein
VVSSYKPNGYDGISTIISQKPEPITIHMISMLYKQWVTRKYQERLGIYHFVLKYRNPIDCRLHRLLHFGIVILRQIGSSSVRRRRRRIEEEKRKKRERQRKAAACEEEEEKRRKWRGIGCCSKGAAVSVRWRRRKKKREGRKKRKRKKREGVVRE